jgi:toxin ParE1/3/4
LKRRIHQTALAESDLIGIWRYTLEQWGADQADRYLVELEAGIGALAVSPGMGISRELVRTGYRVLLIKNHAVYYKVMVDEIRIMRVLHGQMDPGRYLS